MAILKFFRVPKNQQFQYKTRYWDPQKEELEERLRRVEERKKNDVEGAKARISSSFRSKGYHVNSSYRQRQTMRSNMVLFAVIIILVLLAYLLLTVYLPRIVQMVEGVN